jgi:hypothetical protein
MPLSKNVIHDYGIHEAWYHFRRAAYVEIARDRLEFLGIPYTK